jgi:hypothetical protein
MFVLGPLWFVVLVLVIWHMAQKSAEANCKASQIRVHHQVQVKEVAPVWQQIAVWILVWAALIYLCWDKFHAKHP